MAEHTARLPMQFIGGYYWRVDLSWRDDSGDPQHFDTEWTGSITNPPATAYQWWRFRPLVINALNDSGLYALDNVEFEFAFSTSVASALNPENASAAIRLWWSPDGSTWTPRFWGEIDLDDLDLDVVAIVEGSPRKVYRCFAIDSISKLNAVAFSDKTRLSDAAYIVNHASAQLYLGDSDINNVEGNWFQVVGVTKGSTIMPTDKYISIKYYLEEIAKLCFDERYYETVTASAAYYGYGVTPIDGPNRWFANYGGSYPSQSPPATAVVKTFHDLFFLYDLFSAQEHEFQGPVYYDTLPRENWSTEFETWGDCLQSFLYPTGLAVTTRHTIESGRWVRSLQYVSIGTSNGLTITPDGVLLRHRGPSVQRSGRRVVMTTRKPAKSWDAPDISEGAGPEKKITTWFRSIGAANVTQQPDGMTGEHKANILWTVPIIKDGTIYRFVQGMTLPHNSTAWPYATTFFYPAWATNFVRVNGIAQALGKWYGLWIYRAGRRTVQEVRSRLTADDGSTLSIAHLQPFADMGPDDVFLTSDFRLLKVELDAESGHATLTKEEI